MTAGYIAISIGAAFMFIGGIQDALRTPQRDEPALLLVGIWLMLLGSIPIWFDIFAHWFGHP